MFCWGRSITWVFLRVGPLISTRHCVPWGLMAHAGLVYMGSLVNLFLKVHYQTLLHNYQSLPLCIRWNIPLEPSLLKENLREAHLSMAILDGTYREIV